MGPIESSQEATSGCVASKHLMNSDQKEGHMQS